MPLREQFPSVFRDGKLIFTENLVKGKNVYGEQLKSVGGKEYRYWDPNRSKLGAAIAKGLKELPIRPGSQVLYLGISEGTTASHVSDIVGGEGVVFGVDVAPKVMRKLLEVCQSRENILPVLADANDPASYSSEAEGFSFEVVFQDIAQANQTEILVKNCDYYLKTGGYALYAVKSQCIDSSRPPREVFAEVRKDLEGHFELLQEVDLEPYETAHVLFLLRKK